MKIKEIEIFKYSGLKNTNIIFILSILVTITSIFLISIFYNLSSNMKNVYLELKSNYSNDGKYLAVITKNGLWIKDIIDEKIIITNSSYVEGNHLIKNFITEFDANFNVVEIFKVIGLIFLIIIGKSTRQEYIKKIIILSALRSN